VVNAGPDQTINLAASVTLDATVSDDGLPTVPGRVAVGWSKVSGPGTVTFDNANAADTVTHFVQAGIYVLRLTASDGALMASDELTVTVNGQSYADWSTNYFTPAELADPVISGPDADPDGDGFTNNQEFICGTNPRDSQSYLRLEPAALTVGAGNPIRIRFTAVADKSYTVQFADALNGGSWLGFTNITAQATNRVLDLFDSTANRSGRLYRLVTPAVQ
jgi:hypothetical protein